MLCEPKLVLAKISLFQRRKTDLLGARLVRKKTEEAQDLKSFSCRTGDGFLFRSKCTETASSLGSCVDLCPSRRLSGTESASCLRFGFFLFGCGLATVAARSRPAAPIRIFHGMHLTSVRSMQAVLRWPRPAWVCTLKHKGTDLVAMWSARVFSLQRSSVEASPR